MSHQVSSLADIRVASVLSGLEEDKKIAAQSNKTARVKIEKGHAWLVRFLPFTFGERSMPWARIAQHWISGKPCYCKQHTSPDFGGDPNFLCPICEVVDSMYSQSDNDDDRDDFYQCQVRTSFLMYCLVIAKEDDRGRQEVMADSELLTPYEFNIPKTAFGTFTQKLERSKARKGGDQNIGLLSLENGCDLWVARDKKNTYSFDLSDDGYGPIFTLDDHYEGRVVRVWRQLKQPSIKFHDATRLNSIADMLAERSFKEAADNMNPDNQRRARRSRDDEGDQPASRGSGRSFSRSSDEGGDATPPASQAVRPAAPASRSAAPRPAPASAPTPARQTRQIGSRFQSAQAALEETLPPIDDTDQVPGAEVPAQEQSPTEEAYPAEEVPAQEQSPEEAPAAPPPRRVASRPTAVQADDSAVDETDAPQVRRTAGATPRPVATPPAAVSAARRAAPAAVSAAPRAATPAAPARQAPARAAQVDDDPDVLPEEERDPAPPPSQQAPPAAAVPPARSSALSGRLGSRINAMKQNQG